MKFYSTIFCFLFLFFLQGNTNAFAQEGSLSENSAATLDAKELADHQSSDLTGPSFPGSPAALKQPPLVTVLQEGRNLAQVNPTALVKGIVLIDDSTPILDAQELANIQGIELNKISFPGSANALRTELTPFLQAECSSETIRKIKGALYQYFQEQGYPFVLVSFSPGPSPCVLQFLIQESTLGQVHVTGNKWTKESRYTNYLSIKPGEAISQTALTRDVNFMNRNPFRKVDVLYTPGKNKNTTDLTLQVKDRKPYRFYGGMDNTGVLQTGRERVFAGFSWDQLFNFDHSFFYQYTTGFHERNFHANTFQYVAYLPCKQALNLFGGLTIVRSNLPAPNRDNKGTNIQGSARYHIPFFPKATFSQEVIFGFDLKNTNNSIEYVDNFAAFGNTVNLSQWTLAYKSRYEKNRQVLEGGIDCVFSPAQWLPNQTRADFASLRPNADNLWIYFKGFVNYQAALPYRCATQISLNGQWTAQTLLPSEQVGLGGYGTVRGYDEREYNADSGLFGSFELHSPSFSLLRLKKPFTDQLYFLLFFDGGGGYTNDKAPGYPWGNYLLGAGPGVRYSLGSYLTARCDVGFKLHNQPNFTGGSPMVHFSVSASY